MFIHLLFHIPPIPGVRSKELATEPTRLSRVANCKFCNAKRFYSEPPTVCCSEGEISLISYPIFTELTTLLLSTQKKLWNSKNVYALITIILHLQHLQENMIAN